MLLATHSDPRACIEAIARLCVERFAFSCAITIDSPTDGGGISARFPPDGESPPYLHRELLISPDGLSGAIEWGLRLPLEASEFPFAAAIAKVIAAGYSRLRATAAQNRVVSRFQRALLPSQLAQRDSLKIDVAYRPASRETEVGGDWFDAFEVGDGRIGVSVGDIAGHGLDAAVAMGEARRAIRTAAAGVATPSELLDYINASLNMEEHIAPASAIVGFFDPETSVFTYASAGHPPPVYVAPNRRSMALPAGGLLLGFPGSVASSDHALTIEPGASLFLYTDGLIEYDRDIVGGEAALRSAVEQLSFDESSDQAQELHDRIFSSISNRDDCATIVLRNLRTWRESETFVYSAEPAMAAVARAAIAGHPAVQMLDRCVIDDIIFSTGEAVANSIEHGARVTNPRFRADLSVSERALTILIENDGQWQYTKRDDTRGRGMHIMQRLVSGFSITTNKDRTAVKLTFDFCNPGIISGGHNGTREEYEVSYAR